MPIATYKSYNRRELFKKWGKITNYGGRKGREREREEEEGRLSEMRSRKKKNGRSRTEMKPPSLGGMEDSSSSAATVVSTILPSVAPYSSSASASTMAMELDLDNNDVADFFSDSIPDSRPLDSDFFNSFDDPAIT